MSELIVLLLGWLLCALFGVSVVAAMIVVEQMKLRKEQAHIRLIEELVQMERARWDEAERQEADRLAGMIQFNKKEG